MNNKNQDKKSRSNARIAWDEFIGNFSLNGKKDIAMETGQLVTTVAGGAVKTPGRPEEKLAWNFPDYDKMEAIPAVRATPPRLTVIGEEVEIVGNCKIEGDVEIYGEVTGDIQAGGTIGVYGKVTGNMSGKNVLLNSAVVKGSIIAEKNIELDDNSVVTDGKISADTIISNGKTECDMEIAEIARFGASANASGNIRTDRISIEEGAIIQVAIASK